ncbi:MAG: xylulokinase [Chloroflexia bacterium]|nr:xylulokinase [Chloroflexia bacterium]
MPLVAGIDSSTQSCTVVLRDADTGEVRGTASAPHPRTTPPRSEQHPDAWWQALMDAFAAVGDGAGVGEVAAIGIGGQGHGLVALDAAGVVIRPAKLWNDTTSTAEARQLVAELGRAEWARRAGSVPVAAFTITKLLWLRRHEPGGFRRLRRVALPHDWLNLRLTGRQATDRSEASGTGYFSPASGHYDLGLLGLVDPERDWAGALSEVVPPDEAVGEVRPEVAAGLGLGRGVLVAPGANDNPASALAYGLRPGDTVVSLGTSGTVFAPHDEPVADPSGAVNGNADATGAFLPLVCTLNATKVTDFAARLLGVDHAALGALALAAPADPDRPVLQAFLDGERVPERPAARGILAGLRSDSSREEVARAAFEGVLLGLHDGLLALECLGVRTDGRLLATGGGARSPAYRQFLADIFDRPVHYVDLGDAAALGAAAQAAAILRGVTVAEVAAAWAPATEVVAEPRPGQAIEEVRARYRRLLAAEDLDG